MKTQKFVPRIQPLTYSVASIAFLLLVALIIYTVQNISLSFDVILFLLLLSFFSVLTFLVSIKGLLLAKCGLYYYGLKSDSIVISLPFSKRKITFAEIKEVKKLKPEETRDFVYRNTLESMGTITGTTPEKIIAQTKKLGSMSPPKAKYYKNLKDMSSFEIKPNKIPGSIKETASLYRYNTYPIRQREYTLEPQRLKHDFILITLKDGNKHLISPKDVDGFIDTFKKLKKKN